MTTVDIRLMLKKTLKRIDCTLICTHTENRGCTRSYACTAKFGKEGCKYYTAPSKPPTPKYIQPAFEDEIEITADTYRKTFNIHYVDKDGKRHILSLEEFNKIKAAIRKFGIEVN